MYLPRSSKLPSSSGFVTIDEAIFQVMPMKGFFGISSQAEKYSIATCFLGFYIYRLVFNQRKA